MRRKVSHDMGNNCSRARRHARRNKVTSEKCCILAIPAELRLSIYDFYFCEYNTNLHQDKCPALLQVCKQFHNEVRTSWFSGVQNVRLMSSSSDARNARI